TFIIKAVPLGPYYLRVGKATHYAMTARTGIDLGYWRGGRPDAQAITISPTNLSLNLTNLAPWQAPPMQNGDTMELFSLGANAWGDLPAVAPTSPAAGDTMISGFTPDLSGLFVPGLIDGTKGDKTILTDVTTRVSAGISYQALAKSLTLPQ